MKKGIPTEQGAETLSEEQYRSKKIDISIIIPTLNEEDFIQRLLEDIADQRGNFEIIVSDSGSLDKTTEIVQNFIQRHPEVSIQLVKAHEKGVSKARNTGAYYAQGEYLLFLDADTRIPQNFTNDILAEMRQRNLDAAGCYLVPNSKRFLDKTIFYLHQHLILKPLQYTKRPGAAGTGIIVKKNVHFANYGFDENFKYNEDLEYVKKISANHQFRMLNSTNIIFSTRRFDEEGRPKVWLKYAISGLCYILDLKYVNFEYEFGKFSKNLKKNQELKSKMPLVKGKRGASYLMNREE